MVRMVRGKRSFGLRSTPCRSSTQTVATFVAAGCRFGRRVALIASGAVGGTVMSASMPARAAAVVTFDLQAQPIPSFATVVERVKPAVVSVKVKSRTQRPARKTVG